MASSISVPRCQPEFQHRATLWRASVVSRGPAILLPLQDSHLCGCVCVRERLGEKVMTDWTSYWFASHSVSVNPTDYLQSSIVRADTLDFMLACRDFSSDHKIWHGNIIYTANAGNTLLFPRHIHTLSTKSHFHRNTGNTNPLATPLRL